MNRIQEANALTGRVFRRISTGDQFDYTVTSASVTVSHDAPEWRIHVYCPATNEYLVFDSLETFKHFAYGTPVPSGAGGER